MAFGWIPTTRAHGYIIHGFTKKDIYVLESMYYGNATYIFGDGWEQLSKMTKAEVLNEQLQKARIVHRLGWKNKLEQIVEYCGIKSRSNLIEKQITHIPLHPKELRDDFAH